MFLHLGQSTVVRGDDIIGIFDIENTTISKITRDYLTAAEKNNKIVNVSYELPKSFVVCGKAGTKENQTVYISQISTSTLLKRTGNKGV